MEGRYKQKTSEFLQELEELFKVKPITLQEIRKNKEKYNFPAVYVIYTPKDKVIYAGKTKTRNLYDRIGQHIYQNHKCDLRVMIKHYEFLKDKDYTKYLVRYLHIDNNKKRGLFENFVIAILNPPCNRVEN